MAPVYLRDVVCYRLVECLVCIVERITVQRYVWGGRIDVEIGLTRTVDGGVYALAFERAYVDRGAGEQSGSYSDPEEYRREQLQSSDRRLEMKDIIVIPTTTHGYPSKPPSTAVRPRFSYRQSTTSGCYPSTETLA